MASQSNWRSTVAGIALLVAVYLMLAFGLYTNITSRVLGANDFYPRWVGAQALLLRGENPYSDAVTRQIQFGMYGRLARPDEDQVAFAYPIYAAFVVAPLVGLPYAQVQALWMALLVVALIAGSVLILVLSHRALAPPLVLACLVGAILFYPSVRAVFMGQMAVVSFLFLVLAFWAIDRHWDAAAGVLLALATVKPQTALLLAPVALVWAARHRRWRVVVSAAGSIAALVVAGLVLMPSWPIDFMRALGAYAQYEPVGPPVQILAEALVPAPWSIPLAYLTGGIVIGWALWCVVAAIDAPWGDFLPVLYLVAVVTTLTAGRVGSSDQVLLLMPWLHWVAVGWQRVDRWKLAAAAGAVMVVVWAAFFVTLNGNYEYPGLAVLLPLVSLAVFYRRPAAAEPKPEAAL